MLSQSLCSVLSSLRREARPLLRARQARQGLFAPSYSLTVRKSPGLLAVIWSFYTSQHKPASAEKSALMIHDSNPYDRINSKEQDMDVLREDGTEIERRCRTEKSWSGMKTHGDNVIGKDTDWEPDIWTSLGHSVQL